MKNLIPKDSRYIPLTQQKWCCVPTCIQMVMLRRGLPLVPAEEIGNMMGLVVPKSDLKFFWSAETGERPKSGWGTRAGEKRYNPNAILKKLGVSLKFVGNDLIDRFEKIQEVRDFLLGMEEKDRDVLVCFDWGKLTGEKFSGGHVCVFDRFDVKKDEVRLIDPEYFAPKWRVVKMEKLFKSMKYHGAENSGGFWRIEKLKSSISKAKK